LKLDMPVSASLVDQDHSALSEVSASRSARAALMDITARPPRGWAVVCRSVRLLARQPACVIAHGDQGGTFNGNPLMCAVGLAVMNTVLADGFLDQVRAAGDHLGERLQTLSAQYGLGAARGVGLLRALDLGQPLAATVVARAREQLMLGGAAGNTGLLLNAPRPSVLRFMPAPNVTPAEVDLMIDGLRASLDALGVGKVATRA
jgi:acetylornithine/N-succinyldiaminopimelate aminotransferase